MREERYDGYTPGELAKRLGVPDVELHGSVSSTMDIAHALGASGATAGTLVLAERQVAGRGRSGRRWASEPGAGLWLTLLERPPDSSGVELLSLRAGLRAAPVLDPWARARVELKWPNDLYAGGKLGGILIEARWRETRLDWIAIGVGINVRAPADVSGAAALAAGADRVQILSALVPALRAAAAALGPLDARELDAFAARDRARGRRCREPVRGVVLGIDAFGALCVHTESGDVTCRSGSLVLEEDT